MLAHGVAALRGARLSDQSIHICATLSITLHGTGRITGLPGPLQDADVGRIISRNKRVKVELRHCDKDPTASGQRTALEHVAIAHLILAEVEAQGSVEIDNHCVLEARRAAILLPRHALSELHVARAKRLQCRRHRIAIHDDARELHALLVIPCKSHIADSR